MEQYVSTIVENLKYVLSKECIVLLLSMSPILELRAGMIAAALLKIPYLKACMLCLAGNILPIPGSGAWTASLVSSVFHYDIKKASIAIFIGVILTLIIMSIVSYGVLTI